jgi:DNA-binding FadR family transcriptional regulator
LLTGGAGFMFGTLMGFLIQGLIQTYITFDGKLSSWWSKIVTGFLLFAFIAFPRKTARRPEPWRDAMKSNLVVIPPGRGHSNQAEVTHIIGIDIIVDRYPEGTSLPREAELTAMFDVSRTVLRESVKTLSAKGPLKSKAGVGARVTERSAWNMFDSDVVGWHLEVGIDKRFLRDLADIRLAAEPRAAALPAERRADDAIAILRGSIVKPRSFASDSIEFADADLRLHLDVAAFSANPFMRSIGDHHRRPRAHCRCDRRPGCLGCRRSDHEHYLQRPAPPWRRLRDGSKAETKTEDGHGKLQRPAALQRCISRRADGVRC